ncbi:MAG: hypothetical protein AAF555_08370 [Verrucomicrobiota bacterium]
MSSLLFCFFAGIGPSAVPGISAGENKIGMQNYQEATDAMALVLLATVAVITIGVSLVALHLFRRHRQPHPTLQGLEDLAEEERRPPRLPAGGGAAEEREPWEKEGDWWRKD